MKKLLSSAEGDAETMPEAPQLSSDEAPAALPDKPLPNPAEGGSYRRDPATGELTKVED